MNSISLFSDIPVIPRAIIFAYLDNEDAAKVTQVFAEHVPDEVRFPFHCFDKPAVDKLKAIYVKESAEYLYALGVFEKFGRDRSFLNKTMQNPQDTPAFRAFVNRNYGLASFYIRKKGSFPIAGHPSIQEGNNLYFQWPALSAAVMTAIWDVRKPGNAAPLQNMMEAICRRGHAPFLEEFLNKVTIQDRSFLQDLRFGKSLLIAINGGFYDTVKTLAEKFDFGQFNQRQKSVVVGQCIEKGYPKLPSILDFPINELQKKLLETLTEAIENAKKDPARTAPVPINAHHSSTHGGSSNEQIYQKEFKKAVAYAHFFMSTYHEEDCYSQLLLNLGHRRHRMAILGDLASADHQGILMDDDRIMETELCEFEERIKQKYKGKTIQVEIEWNKEKIPLTTITPGKWIHPKGKNGKKVLAIVNQICKSMESKSTQTKEEFVRNVGSIIWYLAHGAPWARGTPTISYIFADALCKLYKFPPLNKIPDLNTEALTYDTLDEFNEWLSTRKDFFIN